MTDQTIKEELESIDLEWIVEAWESSDEDIHICADGSVNFGRKNILSPMGARELEEAGQLETFLVYRMVEQDFFPNIWRHSDHGNVTLLAIQDREFVELGGLV